MNTKTSASKTQNQEFFLRGIPISRGIALGKAFIFSYKEGGSPEFIVSKDDVDHEVVRYERALDATKKDIQSLQDKLRVEKIEEGAAILEGHLQMMRDPLMTQAVEEQIRLSRRNAESVFSALIREFQAKFHALEDPFFRERFRDIQDISHRVISHLRKTIRVTLADIPKGSVVFAEELSAADAAEARSGDLRAFVTESGGLTSHAAIVAKAKGIPYVTNIEISQLAQYEGCDVIVDGREGAVIINPNSETYSYYRLLALSLQEHHETLVKITPFPAETIDGYAIRLSANLDGVDEIDFLEGYGGEGVGLFRSEHAFLCSKELPSEEAQYAIYRKAVEKLEGQPLVIRTFDFGGDKQVAGCLQERGSGFLGCRSLRYLLEERDLFKAQLSAILRAAEGADVSILLPMVSALSELQEAKELLQEVKRELAAKGIPHKKKIPIGCMIEVPSAALIADLLCKQCDFLSIGTNDLVQYSLAVDRGNQALQHYYTPSHPGIIRLIKFVVQEANRHSIPVSVCGEIAVDPRFTPLLLGLGVHELSLSPRYLPSIKHVIRNSTILEAVQLAEEALSLERAEEILTLLEEKYRLLAPNDRLYNFV